MSRGMRLNDAAISIILSWSVVIAIGLFWWLAPAWLPVWGKIVVTLGFLTIVGAVMMIVAPRVMQGIETSEAVPATPPGASSRPLSSRGTTQENRPNTGWGEVKVRYGQHISGDPVDDHIFPRARLHTFYRDHRHADSVLSRVADDAAAALQPTNEGISEETGEPRYHVVHEGTLTGKQIQDYLVTVVQGGGEVWEVLL